MLPIFLVLKNKNMLIRKRLPGVNPQSSVQSLIDAQIITIKTNLKSLLKNIYIFSIIKYLLCMLRLLFFAMIKYVYGIVYSKSYNKFKSYMCVTLMSKCICNGLRIPNDCLTTNHTNHSVLSISLTF